MRFILPNILLRVKSSVFHYSPYSKSQLKVFEHKSASAVSSIFFRNMSQKNITSFFKVTPRNPAQSNEDDKKTSKRLMLYSGDSDQEVKSLEMSPPPYLINKKYRSKRQRIDSSDSEESLESGNESPHMAIANKMRVKTYASPKTKKAKIDDKHQSESNSSESDSSDVSNSSHIKKQNIKTYVSPKAKKANLVAKITTVLEKDVTGDPIELDENQIREYSPTTLNVDKIKESGIVCDSSNPTTVDTVAISDAISSTEEETTINCETNTCFIENNDKVGKLQISVDDQASDIPVVSEEIVICEAGSPNEVNNDNICDPNNSIQVNEDNISVPQSSTQVGNDVVSKALTQINTCENDDICKPTSTTNSDADGATEPCSPIEVDDSCEPTSLSSADKDKIYDLKSPTQAYESQVCMPSTSKVTDVGLCKPSTSRQKDNIEICKPSTSWQADHDDIIRPSTSRHMEYAQIHQPSTSSAQREPSAPVPELVTRRENGGGPQEDDIQIPTVPEREYDPGKRKYHPVSDACWRRGAPVPYLALARTFQTIEGTSSRKCTAETLANYFRSVMVLTPEDLLPSVYMCLNQLAPRLSRIGAGHSRDIPDEGSGASTGMSVGQVRANARRVGDLGVAANNARRTQRCMRPPTPLRVRQVFESLREIARMSGQASVSKKISKIQTLFTACRGCEAKFLIRSLEGKLRIGLAEQTMLHSLAIAATVTPPGPGPVVYNAIKGLSADDIKDLTEKNVLILKSAYCECPNYEQVVSALLKYGLPELRVHCKLTPGVPLKPMLAHPGKSVSEALNRFENEKFTCEWKYDGERGQIHVPANEEGGANLAKAAIFSRNQEDNTSKFPDVLARLPKLLKESVTSCILDCEVVAYDPENKHILSFQILSTRKRKDAALDGGGVAVCVFIFDLLYLNGEPLVRKSLEERRALLLEHFNTSPGEWEFANSKDCNELEEIQEFIDDAVRGNCEGLMVKALQGPRSYYDIARRSRNWLKLKKDYLEGGGDSVDVVVIGAYEGKGRRAGLYGGFLLACFDKQTDEYQTLCKLGTGFSDDELRRATIALKQHIIPQPKHYYRYDISHRPDVWLAPVQVWEVRAADISLSPTHRAAIGLAASDRGLSLRFPRFVRVRDDKTPENATSANQIFHMFLDQDRIEFTSRDPADDFY
ncbi:hypothetical protein ACJJTC_013626 [Scirpophaga incertulas]